MDISKAQRSPRGVVFYRFGLGGRPRLSLRHVGAMPIDFKEGVRQIQNAALKQLRSIVSQDYFPQPVEE